MIILDVLSVAKFSIFIFLEVNYEEKGNNSLHLFSCKDKSLLRWWDSFLLFHTFLDSLHLVCWLNVNLNLWWKKTNILLRQCLAYAFACCGHSKQATLYGRLFPPTSPNMYLQVMKFLKPLMLPTSCDRRYLKVMLVSILYVY